MSNKVSLLRKPDVCAENISQSRKDVDILWEEVIALRKKVVQLLKKNESLTEKSRTNSRNSSTSPSQDPNKKIVKKRKSKRKQGAQPGHKGTSRKLVPASKVDKVENCLPTVECSCKGSVQIQFDNYTRDHEQRKKIYT